METGGRIGGGNCGRRDHFNGPGRYIRDDRGSGEFPPKTPDGARRGAGPGEYKGL